MSASDREQPSDDDSVEAVVDVTLIDQMLELTIEQRLRQNDRMLRMVDQLRSALASSGEPFDGRTG
jgi:hypothetical protein